MVAASSPKTARRICPKRRARTASGSPFMQPRHPNITRPPFSATWKRSSPPQSGQGPVREAVPALRSCGQAACHSLRVGIGACAVVTRLLLLGVHGMEGIGQSRTSPRGGTTDRSRRHHPRRGRWTRDATHGDRASPSIARFKALSSSSKAVANPHERPEVLRGASDRFTLVHVNPSC